MINTDSRYATAVIQTDLGPNDDTRQVMSVPFPTAKMITYTYYRVVAAERIDTIAYNFYGDAKLWWKIADANPEIMDWFDLQPGQVLRVPNG